MVKTYVQSHQRGTIFGLPDAPQIVRSLGPPTQPATGVLLDGPRVSLHLHVAMGLALPAGPNSHSPDGSPSLSGLRGPQPEPGLVGDRGKGPNEELLQGESGAQTPIRHLLTSGPRALHTIRG